jgi:Zn-dependent peptidase ImmA (M78 family)
MLLYELADSTREIIMDFVEFTTDFLGISEAPRIKIVRDSDYSRVNHSFGSYDASGTITVQIQHRQILDILRTLAHELVHYAQHQRDQLNSESGATGSREENQANSIAGIVLRNYARANPELFARAAE